MNNARILQIVREETFHQEGVLFEGMSYVTHKGYRNNQLIEVHGPQGKQLIAESAIDTIQSVLDYAGFVPVIGDVMDGINSLIYFIRKKWMDGIFALVAIVPVVGSGISKGLKALFDWVGRPLANIIKKLTTNGKGAATAFFNLINKLGSKAKALAKPIFDLIKKGASNLASALGKINVASFNKKLMDFSWGWVGLPNWAIKSLDGFVGQLKSFFTHMAKPPKAIIHVTQKKIERTVHHQLLPHEEEKATELYNDGSVDKKKYPQLKDFLEAQIELKKKKPTKKKKPVAELKLWSKDTDRVKKLQKLLGIKVDGVFGDTTEIAVKKYQKKNGLSQDGVVGPTTWAKMT